MTEPRHLARSEDGLVIHRDTCRHARAPWYGADRVSDDELLDAKVRLGYRTNLLRVSAVLASNRTTSLPRAN